MSNVETKLGPLPRALMPRDLPPIREAASESYAPPHERDRLTKLADELDRRPLDEISYRVTHLNYGDYRHFCEVSGADPEKLWAWVTKDRTQP